MNLTESQRQLFLAISLRMSNVVIAEKIKSDRKGQRKASRDSNILNTQHQ
jgi:hypothetical protein